MHLAGECAVRGEVQDRVIGKMTLLRQLLELRFGGVGTEQYLTLGHTQPPADRTQLIGGLGQRRPQTYLLNVGVRATEQLGESSQWPGRRQGDALRQVLWTL